MRSRITLRRPHFRNRGLSARSKLTIMLITVALTALFMIGLFSWQSSRTALNNTVFNQLTSIRSIKARQVETYFQSMRSHLQVLTEDETIIAAMVRFNRAFRELDREHIPPLWDIRLETYYDREVFPRLTANIAGTPEYDNYKPRGQAATYLQYYYLATNVAAPEAKADLEFARDDSEYSTYHAEYHPWLRNLITELNFDDLYLVDFESGDIVYSVQKKIDFATNLQSGAYSRGGLAQVVQAVQANPARYAIQIVDFQAYQPIYGAPAAFLAAPIYNGPHVIGILALQLPVAELNRIMTGAAAWRADGLGETGETYLVGADYFMRSQARLLEEDPAAYRTALTNAGVASAQIDLIERQGTSILHQPVRTAATTAAIAGTTGSQVMTNYRGETVLSAFTPLRLEGLKWVLVAEIDAAEAFAPVTLLTRNLIIAAAILVALITFLAVILATAFMRPVMTLIAGTRQLGKGADNVEILVRSQDEFGELARTFNDLIHAMSSQTKQLESQNREYLNLLLSNLPESVVERVRNGDRRIIDQVARATVLFVRVSDYADLLAKSEAEATALLINELDDAFYEAAERHDLVLFKLIGQQYVAVCGLVSQRLDHARRTVDLAMSMRNIVNNFNLTNESRLTFQAGIDSGRVMGGIIDHHTFAYDLWGDAVRVAQEVKIRAQESEILVTQAVYQQVQALYTFTQTRTTVSHLGTALPIWRLEQSADDRLPSASVATAEEEEALDDLLTAMDESRDDDAYADEGGALTEEVSADD